MERAGVSNLKTADCTGATIVRPVRESAALRALTIDQWLILIVFATALAAGLSLAPDTTGTTLIVGTAIAFLGLAVWRLALIVYSERSDAVVAELQVWPRYTILAALYDETEVLEQLIERLSQIEYPADRLQGLLVLEAHDHDTIQGYAAPRMAAGLHCAAGRAAHQASGLELRLAACDRRPAHGL